jgi:predicted Fe-Mo cluster-binding NifX family protein
VKKVVVVVVIPSSNEGGLNDMMDSRFGRCKAFTCITLKKKQIQEVKIVPNPARDEMGGAGILASQTVFNSGGNDVIVGFLGPNAINSLRSLNLKVYQAPSQNISVKEALNLYLNGELSLLEVANVNRHHGAGRGMGRGMGRNSN